jgi:acetyl esterase/lipase
LKEKYGKNERNVLDMEATYLWKDRAPMALGDSEEDRPRVTPYLVSSAKAPVFIVCPGGAYVYRAAHEGEPIALWLNSLGISAFVLDYRVAPYQPDVSFLDAKRAIRLIRSQATEWNIDAERIGVIGFSAGGHLAALMGTRFDAGDSAAEDPIERMDSRPQLLVLAYPFISVSLESEPKVPEDFAPDKWITASTPPTFLWHTSDDARVLVANSIRFAEGLGLFNIPYSLHIFAKGQHGLGLAEDHPECSAWTSLCAKWLQGQNFIQS